MDDLIGDFDQCNLCGKPIDANAVAPPSDRKEDPDAATRLYGHLICVGCQRGFAKRRQLAFVLDAAAFMVVWFFALDLTPMLLTGINRNTSMTESAWLFSGIFTLFLMKDGLRGFSPAGLLFRVRVVHDKTDKPIGPWTSWKRNLLLGVPPYIGAMIFGHGYEAGYFIGFMSFCFLALFEGGGLLEGPRILDPLIGTRTIPVGKEHHGVFTRKAVCNGCGYDLRGNRADTCPECGTSISRIDLKRLSERNEKAQR